MLQQTTRLKLHLLRLLAVFLMLQVVFPRIAEAQTQLNLIARGTTAQAGFIENVWAPPNQQFGWGTTTRVAGVGDWEVFNGSTKVANSVNPQNWSANIGGQVTVPANAAAGNYTVEIWEQNNWRPASPPLPPAFRKARYNFQVVVLTIIANGTEISKKTDGTQTPANVMVGQQVQLSASISPSLTISSMSWDVPGNNRIKTFAITPWTPADPNADPPVAEVKPKGEKVDLTSSDLQANQSISPTFYFTSGSLSGTDVEVTCSVVVNGKTVSNKGKIKVKSPEMAAVTAADQAPDREYGPVFGPLKGQWTSLDPTWGIRNRGGSNYLMLGYNNTWANSGFHWSGGVNVPTDVSGEIAFIQVVDTERSITTGTTSTSISSSAVLDTKDGTVPLSDKRVSVSSTTPNVNYIWKTDSPGNGVDGTTSTSLSDSFKTYFVFRPTGGIWVTLGILNWSISASSNSVPEVTPGTLPAIGGGSITGSASSTLPEWGDSTQALKKRNGFE